MTATVEPLQVNPGRRRPLGGTTIEPDDRVVGGRVCAQPAAVPHPQPVGAVSLDRVNLIGLASKVIATISTMGQHAARPRF